MCEYSIYIGEEMGAFLDQPITEKRIEKYQHKKLRACTAEMQGSHSLI